MLIINHIQNRKVKLRFKLFLLFFQFNYNIYICIVFASYFYVSYIETIAFNFSKI